MKRQAITLGRVGILLPIAAIIPLIGALASIATLVLLVISHYYFSKVYEKPGIFNNALTGTIVHAGGNLIGVIIIAVAVGATALSLSLQDPETFNISEITSLIFGSGATIAGAIIILAGSIVGLYFVYKALTTLAEQTGVRLFKTAGLLYFIGAIAMVIFFIGTLVIFAAWIIHIIAYFSIPLENEPMATTS